MKRRTLRTHARPAVRWAVVLLAAGVLGSGCIAEGDEALSTDDPEDMDDPDAFRAGGLCTDFGAPTQWIGDYGVTQGWDQARPRLIGDVNGDHRDDVVAFGGDGTYVSLSTGSGFGPRTQWANAFGLNAGGWTPSKHLRMLADVNGDGLQDIVGFGNSGVAVALSNGNGFNLAQTWLSNAFAYNSAAGSWRVGVHPRMLSDVTGDGLPDIVGFANWGVYVSVNTGSSFGPAQNWRSSFGANQGWNSSTPRYLADVNGDGRDDIVAFGTDGVHLSLSTGASFGPDVLALADFSASLGGFSTAHNHPRMMADVNGDGLADIVGFHGLGVYVSLSNGTGFDSKHLVSTQFRSLDPWTQDTPRMLADINYDGMADIIGMHDDGVWVAASNGSGFENAVKINNSFGTTEGWSLANTPRMLGDVDGDDAVDIVGFGNSGVHVSASACPTPENASIAIGRGGYVQTDVSSDEFLDGDFTLTAWFMPQWTRGVIQPILASSTDPNEDNGFLVGLDYYHTSAGYPKIPDNEIGGDTWGQAILVNIEGASARFTPSPALNKDRWYHLALRRQGCNVALLIDGVAINPDAGTPPLSVCNAGNNASTASNLRLGATQTGHAVTYPGSSGYRFSPQYYGLIDDAAVFDRALSTLAVKSIVASKRLRGDEYGLVAGFSFDSSHPLPATLQRSTNYWNYKPGLSSPSEVVTSRGRFIEFDREQQPEPSHLTQYQLPFAVNEPWFVAQGYGWPTSHNNVGAFCKDFTRSGGSYQAPVYAVADGELLGVSTGSPTEDNANVYLQTAPGESSRYLHLAYDPPGQVGDSISEGGLIGSVGTHPNGAHLHYCTLDIQLAPNGSIDMFTPFPMEFSNYEVAPSANGPWTVVSHGVPEAGTWVRRRP